MLRTAIFILRVNIAKRSQRKKNKGVAIAEMASGDSAFECGICNEDYDSSQHKPLILTCGHTFCHACLLRIASGYDKQCPNCRKQITQTVHELAVNYALIRSDEKASTSASPPGSVDLCRSHDCYLDYFCVDCGDLGCRKCTRDLHFNHKVESIEDIMGDDSVAYARIELRQKMLGKLIALKGSLLIHCEMEELFENLKRHERECEDLRDFRQVMETSVAKDLETWDALILSPDKKSKETLKDIMRRLNEVNPPQIENLSQIREKIVKLGEKAAELEKFNEGFADLNSEQTLDNDDTPELLPDDGIWTVASEASVKSAFASITAGRRPTKVGVVSKPTEPIRRLPARLSVLGSACVGAMEVKPLDFFWRASTGADERLREFIEKHGHKVSEFYGSPDDALLVCSASRQSDLSLGVRLCSMSDLDRCSALTVKPYSVCCIPGLPAGAGASVLELGWRPFLWHFPDFHDRDLDWMMELLAPFVPPPYVKPVWITCASILGMRLFRCHLPRCRLTEEGFRHLLERCPVHAPVICCETASLSAEARTRLTALAEDKGIQLRWEIPF